MLSVFKSASLCFFFMISDYVLFFLASFFFLQPILLFLIFCLLSDAHRLHLLHLVLYIHRVHLYKRTSIVNMQLSSLYTCPHMQYVQAELNNESIVMRLRFCKCYLEPPIVKLQVSRLSECPICRVCRAKSNLPVT